LSAKGHAAWRERVEQGLRLKLVAAIRERATDSGREESYRARLQTDAWWTGVWEGRWRS